VTVYLDTSSFVKLYMEEEGADAVVALVRAATLLTTSAVAYAETRAALARRQRERALRPAAAAAVIARLDADWSRVAAIEVTSVLARRAGLLAERHALRGFDAIHLASFELVLERAGAADVHFSSADGALTRAARRLGRTARPLPSRQSLGRQSLAQQ
jgi:predicted nucleic acid-binding protein